MSVTALADGRLSGRSLLRAQRHLAACPRCAALLAQERETANRLRSLRTFTYARVPALPHPGEPGRWERLRLIGAPAAQRRRAAGRAAVTGFAVVAVAGVVLLLGAAAERTVSAADLVAGGRLDRSPAVFASALAVARPAAQPSAEDTTAVREAVLDAGWVVPELADGLTLSRVMVHRIGGQEVLEVEVSGLGGTVHLYEVAGSVEALPAGVPDTDVVQCGGIGVAVHGDQPLRAHVADALPRSPFDDSVSGRFDRGVTAILSLLGGGA